MKDNDNDNDDEIMLKIRGGKYFKKYSLCEWLFLLITITISTNKMSITTKSITGEKQTIILIYYIETMRRLPCLICNVSVTFIKTKRAICL